VNDHPTATSKSVAANINKSQPIHVDAIDPEGSSLTYELINPPQQGTLSGTFPDVTYSAPATIGVDSFTFRASDGALESGIATITIKIVPLNKITGGGRFGKSVSLSGNRAIIGADSLETAYIYQFTGQDWQLEQVLNAPTSGRPFGSSVSIDGDRAIVSAVGGLGGAKGYVYIYHFNGSQWVLKSTFSGGDQFNNFGTSVAIHGDHAFVGAPANYYIAFGPFPWGNVYKGYFNGVDWVWLSTYSGSNFNCASFGESVAFDGNTLVMGGDAKYHYKDSNGNTGQETYGSGCAVFRPFNGTSFGAGPVVRAGGERFGKMVSISGNHAFVFSGSTTNTLHNYYFDGPNWVDGPALLPASPLSVSGYSNRVVIGTSSDQAELYSFNGTAWNLDATFTPSDHGSNGFGSSVALSINKILVGAPTDSDTGGAVYLFSP
jgi:hypothetical protein